jgi:hypothetical protein
MSPARWAHDQVVIDRERRERTGSYPAFLSVSEFVIAPAEESWWNASAIRTIGRPVNSASYRDYRSGTKMGIRRISAFIAFSFTTIIANIV